MLRSCLYIIILTFVSSNSLPAQHNLNLQMCHSLPLWCKSFINQLFNVVFIMFIRFRYRPIYKQHNLKSRHPLFKEYTFKFTCDDSFNQVQYSAMSTFSIIKLIQFEIFPKIDRLKVIRLKLFRFYRPISHHSLSNWFKNHSNSLLREFNWLNSVYMFGMCLFLCVYFYCVYV